VGALLLLVGLEGYAGVLQVETGLLPRHEAFEKLFEACLPGDDHDLVPLS
jgi:hypothetical protein